MCVQENIYIDKERLPYQNFSTYSYFEKREYLATHQLKKFRCGKCNLENVRAFKFERSIINNEYVICVFKVVSKQYVK